MTANLAFRRVFVVLAVAAALVAGGATVRAAAMWTAASAPLAAPPASLASIQSALEQEKARSAALEQQLQDLTAATKGLGVALDAANVQVATDADTAAALRTSLAEAQAKLESLQKSLASGGTATSAAGSGGSGGSGAAPAPTPEHEGEPNDD